MATKNDGGPAFPTDVSESVEYTNIKGGMSLRDWFAGKAMLGLMSDIHTVKHLVDGAKGRNQTLQQIVAEDAYVFADAMLAEREK